VLSWPEPEADHPPPDISHSLVHCRYHGPGVDSAPSENEYQEHFLGVMAAGA